MSNSPINHRTRLLMLIIIVKSLVIYQRVGTEKPAYINAQGNTSITYKLVSIAYIRFFADYKLFTLKVKILFYWLLILLNCNFPPYNL
jgi:hypothetical protein